MTDDPLDAMKWRWSYIQGYLFSSMREDNDPITEALGRLVTTLDVIGLEAFVPDPPRAPGRPPEDRRALARGCELFPETGDLSIGQGRLPALVRSPLLCQGNSFALSLMDQGPLELGKGTHDGEHETCQGRILPGKG